MAKVYIIHENDEWTIHLQKRLEELEVPYELWHLESGQIDLFSTPPEGVFYSRMSASAHTRGHRFSPEFASDLFAWLERHGRRVINGQSALSLELSKVKQYLALDRFGILTPKTFACLGREQIVDAAKKLKGQSFITKHNRAGKGLGVQLFHSLAALEEYLDGPAYEEPADGITLIQEYVEAPQPFITRAEFIGGKFFYAVRVDTSGGFQLCPADACQIADLFCPVGEQPANQPSKFSILHPQEVNLELIRQYEAFLREHHIAVAGIEFIQGKDGKIYTYDINTNTNYNSDAEAEAGRYGMLEVAKFLQEQLKLAVVS